MLHLLAKKLIEARQQRLDEFETAIVQQLQETDISGRNLREAIKPQAGGMSAASFYQRMAGLEERGIVEGRWEHIKVGDIPCRQRWYHYTKAPSHADMPAAADTLLEAAEAVLPELRVQELQTGLSELRKEIKRLDSEGLKCSNKCLLAMQAFGMLGFAVGIFGGLGLMVYQNTKLAGISGEILDTNTSIALTLGITAGFTIIGILAGRARGRSVRKELKSLVEERKEKSAQLGEYPDEMLTRAELKIKRKLLAERGLSQQ